MSTQSQGVRPTQVDAAPAAGQPELFPIGLEVDDPRGGVFAGNRIKYVKANGSIADGDCVQNDVSFATAADRNATVISTSAVAQMIEGVNDIAGVAITSGQRFWITVRGRAVVKTSAITAATNAKLGTSGTAGTLVAITAATPSNAEVIAAIAAGCGRGCSALSDTGSPVAGRSYVMLR